MTEELKNLKETILKEYPRLNENSTFKFQCDKQMSCFTECCGDVNIVLTPYDVMLLKNRLNLTSDEFLKKYTICPFSKELKLPIPILKMNDDENKRCPFVNENGCTIYDARPWPCRMYPVGLASPKSENEEAFYFVLEEEGCKGFTASRELAIKDWLNEQGINDYNEMGELFKEITLHDYLEKGGSLQPEKIEMFYTACYDLDKFKRFIFDSKFLNYFDVDKDTVNKMKNDEKELLKFGFNWLKFSLFGEKTMKVKNEVLSTKKKELEKKFAAEAQKAINTQG